MEGHVPPRLNPVMRQGRLPLVFQATIDWYAEFSFAELKDLCVGEVVSGKVLDHPQDTDIGLDVTQFAFCSVEGWFEWAVSVKGVMMGGAECGYGFFDPFQGEVKWEAISHGSCSGVSPKIITTTLHRRKGFSRL